MVFVDTGFGSLLLSLCFALYIIWFWLVGCYLGLLRWIGFCLVGFVGVCDACWLLLV